MSFRFISIVNIFKLKRMMTIIIAGIALKLCGSFPILYNFIAALAVRAGDANDSHRKDLFSMNQDRYQ